jgi:hypothetical protein
VLNQAAEKHYKHIAFRENKARLKLLKEFRDLVIKYFDNSRLNMISGSYIEEQEAREARASLNLIAQRVYKIIRLADINPSVVSTTSIAVSGNANKINVILNIFNLGRNDISPNAAIDYIERAIDVYKSNRLYSFFRTINPFFWMKVVLNYII